MSDSDLPIALRRSRRSINGLSARYQDHEQNAAKTPTKQARMPSRRQTIGGASASANKHVRFSDPGAMAHGFLDDNSNTGLTPMVRRTSLGGKRFAAPMTPSPSRRRSASAIWSSPLDMDSPATPFSGSVTFLPLRQVLSGRVKRRLRRNGLSEEMNKIYAERRQRAEAARQELEQLRANVAEKDAEIQRLQQRQEQQQSSLMSDEAADDDNDDTTHLQDQSKIEDLEKQVAQLRRELAAHPNSTLDPTTPSFDWTMAARDPFSSTMHTDHDDNHDDHDDFIDMSSPIPIHTDDDAFGDSTMDDLQCSTPCRPPPAKKREVGFALAGGSRSLHAGSFPTPPATSPAVLPTTPMTPKVGYYNAQDVSTSPLSQPPPPRSVQAAEVQVSLPDAETQLLQDDLSALQLEMTQLETSLEAQRDFVARLNAKLAEQDEQSEETEGRGDEADRQNVEGHVARLLQRLSDKTAALAALSTELCSLGFGEKKGEEDEDDETLKDPSEVVTALATAFRTARLELEYLTPGEIALPLTAAGAAVLDLLLERLRSLGRQVHESGEKLDEYREMEHSLKQQLDARVTAMDGLVREVADREARIAVLEEEKQAAVAAGAAHEQRVAELETGLERLKGGLVNYARDMSELEALVQKLEGTLAERDAALAERDARITELHTELEQANTALRAADETARQLRVDNASLRARLSAGQRRAKTAVAALQTELARMVGQLGTSLLGEEEKEADEEADEEAEMDGGRQTSPGLSSTMTMVPETKRSLDMGEEEDARKRRRYDSLSFLDVV